MKPIRLRPAYQVKEALRRSGHRQSDIARLAGVSRSVVSATVLRRGGIEPTTRDRVWAEIERVTARLLAEAEG